MQLTVSERGKRIIYVLPFITIFTVIFTIFDWMYLVNKDKCVIDVFGSGYGIYCTFPRVSHSSPFTHLIAQTTPYVLYMELKRKL